MNVIKGLINSTVFWDDKPYFRRYLSSAIFHRKLSLCGCPHNSKRVKCSKYTLTVQARQFSILGHYDTRFGSKCFATWICLESTLRNNGWISSQNLQFICIVSNQTVTACSNEFCYQNAMNVSRKNQYWVPWTVWNCALGTIEIRVCPRRVNYRSHI